jgi:tetratricopeptide (TPR) repeat protein
LKIMSGRVTALTTLFGVILIGGLLMPRPAAAQSSNGLDDCLSEAVDTAIAACSTAIKANPNDAEAYQGRGSAFVRRGENERAIADYNAAIKISPEFGLPYFNRGLVLESKNQLKEALSDFKRAAELDPTDDDSKEGVARVTAALARGPAPAWSASSSAPVSSTTGSAPASARNGSVYSSRTSAPPAKTRGSARASASSESALPAKRRVSAQPLPTRDIAPTAPALASSDPAPDEAASEAGQAVATSDPAPASKQERWTFNGSAISNWISGLRRPSSPAPSPANATSDSGQPQAASLGKKPPNDSVIQAQEYWSDQMALANGGSMDTRRIISLERLGELKSSGILSDQEFDREKRRILGE